MRSDALLGVLLMALLTAPAHAEVIESIPAVVDGRPLLLSEVRLVERVRGLEPAAALDALIDEWLMFREALRLPQAATSAEAEARAHADLLERDPALADCPEADLRRLVHRQAAILAYVEFRYRPQVRITDAAIREAYAARYADDAAAPPLETVQDALRQRLADQRLSELIEAWVRDLRAAADIRKNP